MRKNIQIPGLEPNSTYAIQLRGVDDEGNFGLWSTRLQFDTVRDEIAPAPVTNLAVEVDGADFVISWDAPTTDAEGNELDDLRDYIVNISQPGAVNPKQYATVDNTFVFTYNMNVAQFGTDGAPELSIDVSARDRVGNLSTTVATSSTNTAPAAPTLAAVAKRNAVELSWNDTFEDDGRRFEIWKNASKYAEVGPATLTWTDNDVGEGAQDYMVRAVDRFEQSADSNTVTESEVELDTGDTVAPSAPTGAGYTDSAEGLSATATLSWDAPTTDSDATSYTDQEGFDVRYRENAAGRPWNYEKVVDDRADATTARRFELEVEIEAGITLDWEVRAFDRYGNASGWLTSQNAVSEDTTPPSTPAAPTAVGNTQSIQVSHDLTDDAAATLGDNVVRLDIYVGTTSDFASMTKEASVDINRPSLGIDAVTTIPYPVPDTDTDRFVRVVAISSAGIESTESAAASVTVGLVQNAHIADATITNAKIDNVAANKLLAGTAFINDLSVESKLTVNTGGTLESSNFDATARTGWGVDDGNLYLFDGEIDASLIIIQQGANLIDNGYSNFLNDPDWYVDNLYTVGAAVTASISSAIWSRYGSQALRFQAGAAEEVFMGDGATDYNIPIEGSVTYILSAYVYNNAGVAKSIRLRANLDSTGGYNGNAVSINPGEYTRVTYVITTGASDTAMQVGFESIDSSADFLIDGLQVERQIGDLTDPSFFKVGGITTIGGGQITTGTIDANLANIVNINASNINTGTLDADVASVINLEGDSIKAGEITTRELVVGSFDNLTSDPGFESQTFDQWYTEDGAGGAWSIVTGSPRSGAAAARFDTLSQAATAYLAADGAFNDTETHHSATEGDKFYLSAWCRRGATAPVNNPELAIQFRDASGTSLASNNFEWPSVTESYTMHEVSATAPAGTAYVVFYVRVPAGNDSAVLYLFDDFYARRVVEARIIGDLVVGEDIKSDNYVAGSAGWGVFGDGSAEFNNAVIRGDLEVGTDVVLEVDEQSPVGSDIIGVIGWRDNGDYSGQGDAGRIYTGNTRTDAAYPEGAARSLYIEAPYETGTGTGTRPFIEMAYTGSEILAESDALQIKTRLGEAGFQNAQILLADHGSGAFRPQYSFIGDEDTGIYRHSADTVGVTSHLYVDGVVMGPSDIVEFRSTVLPSPQIGENSESTPSNDYPLGLTVSPTTAAAQGWPVTMGSRNSVLTVKSSDNAGFQMLMDSNSNTVMARVIDHSTSTWGPWQNLN